MKVNEIELRAIVSQSETNKNRLHRLRVRYGILAERARAVHRAQKVAYNDLL